MSSFLAHSSLYRRSLVGACNDGGTWFACETESSSNFLGCCDGGYDACTNGCASGDLRSSYLGDILYGSFQDQACSMNGDFYTCGDSGFLGCCDSNPCQPAGCPQQDLGPASLVNGNNPFAPDATSSDSSTPSPSSIQASAQVVTTAGQTVYATVTAGVTPSSSFAMGLQPMESTAISATADPSPYESPTASPQHRALSKDGVLGIGVGIGVPVALAGLGLFLWLFKRRAAASRRYQDVSHANRMTSMHPIPFERQHGDNPIYTGPDREKPPTESQTQQVAPIPAHPRSSQGSPPLTVQAGPVSGKLPYPTSPLIETVAATRRGHFPPIERSQAYHEPRALAFELADTDLAIPANRGTVFSEMSSVIEPSEFSTEEEKDLDKSP